MLEERVQLLEYKLNQIARPERYSFVRPITGGADGLKIGVTTTDKLGFYGKAPIARQTGVAVTAGGIHAALVNLGLITA